jgi:hypothetical protein
MTDEIKKFKAGDRVRHKKFEWEATVKYVYDNGSFKISDYPAWYYPWDFELIESPKKPTVPTCLDDWIKENIEDDYDTATRFHVLSYAFIKRQLNDELEEWFTDNKQTALQALEIGYEVEEEPLYYVKLPGLNEEEECYLNKWRNDNRLEVNNKEDNRVMQTQFTESEIKAIDPWYFEKAVRVEDE